LLDAFLGRAQTQSSYKADPRAQLNSETGVLTKAAELPLDGPNWIKIVRLP